MATNTTSSYIDVEKLTSPDFSPYVHANSLVLSTNNASDASIDLTTPLSKALFDLQEIDSNIHSLTSRSALEILTYTSTQNAAASRILSRVEEERKRLNEGYARLEKEVLGQHAKATGAKLQAERSHQLLRLGRSIQRVLIVARQFEAQLSDAGLAPSQPSTAQSRTVAKDDHRLLLQAARTILSFRDLMTGPDATDLVRINLVKTVRGRVFEDGEARVLDFARRIVREFGISSLTNTAGSTYKDAEDAKSRFASAVDILYLLSPVAKVDEGRLSRSDFEPEYLLRALQGYLQTAITSSVAGFARGLTQLPTLERALLEVSTRCQNVVALQGLLKTIAPPDHPQLAAERISSSAGNDAESSDSNDSDELLQTENLLSVLLESLDTSSLPSYFWRSLASQLSPKVQDVLNRGGLVARQLRGAREDLRQQVRDCVLRGSKMPPSISEPGKTGKEQVVENWEREAAVMVGAVIGPLNR